MLSVPVSFFPSLLSCSLLPSPPLISSTLLLLAPGCLPLCLTAFTSMRPKPAQMSIRPFKYPLRPTVTVWLTLRRHYGINSHWSGALHTFLKPARNLFFCFFLLKWLDHFWKVKWWMGGSHGSAEVWQTEADCDRSPGGCYRSEVRHKLNISSEDWRECTTTLRVLFSATLWEEKTHFLQSDQLGVI